MAEIVTLDDLIARVGHEELAQVAGQGSFNAPEGRSLDHVKINGEIEFTNSLVTSYLATRYPVVEDLPNIHIPEIVRGFGCDIVRYRLRARSGDRNTVTEEVRIRYDHAMKWLKDASRGAVNVPFGDGVAAGATTTATGTVRAALAEPRTAKVLEGYSS